MPEPPTAFAEFAMKELGCDKRTKFQEMEHYYFLLLEEPYYSFFPYTYQVVVLREKYGIEISRQTLSNWEKRLINKDLLTKGKMDAVYFICRGGEAPIEISEQTYNGAWADCYNSNKEGVPMDEAVRQMIGKYGGMPKRMFGIEENVFNKMKLDELRSILRNSGISL